MRKSYVILIYILVILLASVGVTTLVWSDLKDKSMSEENYRNYLNYKKSLLEQENFEVAIDEIDIDVEVIESNSSYLVSTTFTNPQNNYTNLVILVIDQKEKTQETDKIYPSIGIVGDFNNEFVTSAPNKKTTHSKITMNYESESISEGVLIYFEYTENGKKCIFHLNIASN